jgi:putative N-acetyltransferase (TIGR04045 family)
VSPPAERVAVDVRVAESEADLAAHHRVRRAVFVEEQGIFVDHDEDEWDGHAVKVVAAVGSRVLGAVRLYPLDEAGLWKGDRLAVLPEGRRLRIGAPLVRFAVRTAGERGGSRMIALIQRRNVAFFRHLGWSPLGDETDFRGATHQEMTIVLSGAAPEFSPGGYAWALGGAPAA